MRAFNTLEIVSLALCISTIIVTTNSIGCTAVAIDGCVAIDENDTLGYGNASNCGCLTCNNTHDMDANYSCVACSSRIASCSACSNITTTLVCTACEPTHKLNSSDNQCYLCDKTCNVIPLSGCALIDSSNSLETCNLTNCQCLSCNATSDMDANNNCVACQAQVANCSTCVNSTISTICTGCVPNYMLNSSINQCIFCNRTCTVATLLGCIIVDENNTLGYCNHVSCGCLTCATTFGVDPTNNCVMCNSTIPNCIDCSFLAATPICAACNLSYYLNDTTNKCILCNDLYYGCNLCQPNISHCTSCRAGFYMTANYTCVPCSDTLPHPCLRCSSPSTCTFCYPTYGFLSPNVCVLCSSQLPNCFQCRNTTVCTVCSNATNIVLFNNSRCVTCQEAISNCLSCNSSSICLSCATNYGVNYTAAPDTCVQCTTAIPNCQTCLNYTFCQTCVSNFYVLDYAAAFHEVCQLCSSFMAGCATCSSKVACLSCDNSTLYFYNSMSLRCSSCSSFVPNCAKCTASSQCLACEGSQYALNRLWACEACSAFMASCFYCNSSSTCTLCTQGRLLPDRSGCSPTKGCVSVNLLAPLPNNCIACDPDQFFHDPRDAKCICIQGKLIGDYCSAVVGCAGTLNKTYCMTCNVVQNFIIYPKDNKCECIQHYRLENEVCIEDCGDGFVVNDLCDDGNLIDGDGCSRKCKVQTFYYCENDNNRFPASKCQFQAQIRLSLVSIKKTSVPNKANLTFSFSPYSSKLQLMNLASLVTLNVQGCYMSSAKIVKKQLMVECNYNKTLSNADAELKIKFDYQYVKSPEAKVQFVINLEEQMSLVELSNTCIQMIGALSYISLAVFLLGSIAYKLIGVETLFAIQIVRVLQASSKYYNSFFSNFQSLDFSYGQISSFSGNSELLETRFGNLGFRASLNDNSLILTAVNGVTLLIFGSILAYRFKLKLEIKKQFKSQEKKMIRKQMQHNQIISSKIEKINNILSHFYNWVLFPIFIGFFMHFLHTVYVYQTDNSDKQIVLSDFASIFVMFIATALIFHRQLIGQQHGERENIFDTPGKNGYVPYFLINNFSIFLLLTLLMVKQAQGLCYLAVGFVVAQTIYLILRRPYLSSLSNFAVVVNQIFILFSFFWVISKNSSFDTPSTTSLLAYVFIALFCTVNGLAIARSILVLKDRYGESRSKLVQDHMSKPIEKNQQISGSKINVEQINMFKDKLINPINDYIPLDFQNESLLKRENLNNLRQKRRIISEIKSSKGVFNQK